ncbi:MULTISPECIES: porin family protein [Sphingobacterium]|uniref:porin family protein n=1 Tax=Sphingobacterium TaxID=28453 RepID=UPI0019196006|nr:MULTISPECIES: porin family protein [Sphingobacterium]QQT26599.1 PorT family protein [Sphingobacterium spiritivorum]
MKKSLLTVAAAILLSAGLQAQTSYGIKAGLNFSKLRVSAGDISATSDASTNFYVMGYVDAPISPVFSFQPGLSLQGKGGKTTQSYGTRQTGSINVMYLEVPLNFVYYIPAGPGKVFLGAGPYAGIGLRSKGKVDKLSVNIGFDDDGFNRFDAGANFLAGYKLANGFMLNGGYSFGLTNLAKDSDDASLKNRVISVGIGYQF